MLIVHLVIGQRWFFLIPILCYVESPQQTKTKPLVLAVTIVTSRWNFMLLHTSRYHVETRALPVQ